MLLGQNVKRKSGPLERVMRTDLAAGIIASGSGTCLVLGWGWWEKGVERGAMGQVTNLTLILFFWGLLSIVHGITTMSSTEPTLRVCSARAHQPVRGLCGGDKRGWRAARVQSWWRMAAAQSGGVGPLKVWGLGWSPWFAPPRDGSGQASQL